MKKPSCGRDKQSPLSPQRGERVRVRGENQLTFRIALTLALSQRERGQESCLSRWERGQRKTPNSQ